MIPVSICPGKYQIEGYSNYADYCLVYHNPSASLDSWRVSVDKLTISIEPSSRGFLNMDAYAPRVCWLTDTNMSSPQNAVEATMCIECEFDSNGIAGLSGKLTYYANSRRSLIKICLDDNRPVKHYRIAKGIIVDVDSNSSLTALWLEDVVGMHSEEK